MERGVTPSQTIGPFFAIMVPLGGNELVPPGTAGAIVVEGRVLDGAGEPVNDALVELWQAAPDGVYAHPADPRSAESRAKLLFGGFGRCATDAEGRFSFVTVKPGPVPGFDERPQAPHLNLGVFARGLLRRLATRVYFPDEAAANARDPLLCSIEDAGARATLVAAAVGPGRLRFDIRLRGEGETAFLAI
jgi:protocatechuate 3,4-dioxygenase alpha subunit